MSKTLVVEKPRPSHIPKFRPALGRICNLPTHPHLRRCKLFSAPHRRPAAQLCSAKLVIGGALLTT